MKFYLDSAKIDEIRFAYETFGIDGVTTNPRHVMLSGKPLVKVLEELASWVREIGREGWESFPISVEVDPHLERAEDIVAEAEKVAALSSSFVIKIPCTEAGITAARILEGRGIRTNLTLVFSPAQAIFAGRNGCKFVSPFIGWKEDNGEDTGDYIARIVRIYRNYGWYGKTEIICAAVRSAKQIADCADAGADIVTAGLTVFETAMKHAYTNQGLETFCAAWDSTAKE